MAADFAILALLIAGYALVAARLERYSIGPALVFVVIGIFMSERVLGPISIQPDAEPVQLLAEATLALLLFADASMIRPGSMRHDLDTMVRLLVVALLLAIALGTAAALLVFPAIPLGLALLIGSSLAPTDAALGQPVVTNASVPARIRRVLNVESGLNDGIATPFVLLALSLATAEGTGDGGWVALAAYALAAGAVTGIVIGAVGGRLLVFSDRRQWTSPTSRGLLVLALAAACYLASISTGGNGFIGAFVGGVGFAFATRGEAHDAVHFTEMQGSLLAIGVWAAFGLTLAGRVLTGLSDPAPIVYAVLSLTVVRMVPVALSLLGEGYEWRTVLFIGWFGPRGVASVVFLVIALVGLEEAGVDAGPLPTTIAWTVLLSVVLHGLTAGPLATRYGRAMANLAPGARELEEASVTAPSRTSWAGGSRK